MFFLPLTKADEAKRLIWATAAVEEPDLSKEIMDYSSAKPQFQAWSDKYNNATLGKSLGNIRAMHNPQHVAGKVEQLAFDDAGKTVGVCIKVLDPIDWHKIEEGGYTGLSIGGGYLKKWTDPENASLTRYTPIVREISLVDSPCIPSARILELQKQDGSTAEVTLKGVPRTFAKLVTLEAVPRTFAKLTAPPTFNDVRKVAALGKLRHSAAHPGFEAVQNRIAHERGVSRDRAGAILASARQKASASAVHHNPRLKRVARFKKQEGNPQQEIEANLEAALAKGLFSGLWPKEQQRFVINRTGILKPKRTSPTGTLITGLARSEPDGALLKAGFGPSPSSPAARAKIEQVLHEHKQGKLRSWRGTNPRTGKPRKGPVVQSRRQAIAIALNQARRMGKSEPDILRAAIDDELIKRTLAESTRAGARQGAITGGAIGFFGGARHMAGGAALGAAGGAVIGAAHHGIQRILSDKERKQRVAAAKARWMNEGHHDLDQHFDGQHKQASQAILGRKNKVASVALQRHAAWNAVADAQDAYDKVKKHLPDQAHLMMEVPHMGGVLYNPEAVGEKHFDRRGNPRSDIYMLHPSEADDWVKKHGKSARAVTKLAPGGRVRHISDPPLGKAFTPAGGPVTPFTPALEANERRIETVDRGRQDREEDPRAKKRRAALAIIRQAFRPPDVSELRA